LQLLGEVEKLAPFGVGNSKPNFLLKQAPILEIQKFGKEGQHLKIIFEQTAPNLKWPKKISAIKFFAEPDAVISKYKAGDKINLVFNLEKSFFGSYPELRMRIVHLF
jgi:single-stranded-DNA-specific exonuclease